MFTLKVDDEISLRLHDLYDVEAFYHLIKANRDHVGQFMDWVDQHKQVADTRSYLLDERRHFANRDGVATKIYYQDELVGSIAITVHNKRLRLAEVGYWLDEGATGKGIATRAARALVDYGFGVLGLHKIIIRAMPHNERSLAIPKRLGFKHQGLDVHAVLHYGKYYDFDTYYMLEEDWTATRPAPEFGCVVSDNIELRLFEPHHADALFALTDANRTHITRWLPIIDDVKVVDDTLKFIKSGLEQYADNDGLQMGVWYDGELCGACGYHYWDFTHKNTEIGYWLAQNFTGKGIMTKCVKVLVDYAFSVLGLHRIEIQCAAGNTKSCAIPERLGFRYEGIVRDGEFIKGVYHDAHIYAVLADEWS